MFYKYGFQIILKGVANRVFAFLIEDKDIMCLLTESAFVYPNEYTKTSLGLCKINGFILCGECGYNCTHNHRWRSIPRVSKIHRLKWYQPVKWAFMARYNLFLQR